MIRSVPLILLGLAIDGLQAGISMAIASVAAAPGTALGAAGGCAAGNWLVGEIGCWIGGLVVGIAGTAADPFLAPATIPMGIMLGFAISFCLSITLGAGLIAFLAFNGMVYPKYWFGGVGEVIPGINIIPFWTSLVVLCALKKNAEEGGSIGKALSPGSALGKIAGGVMGMKERTTNIADSVNAFESPVMAAPIREYKQQQDERGDWLEQENDEAAQNNSAYNE